MVTALGRKKKDVYFSRIWGVGKQQRFLRRTDNAVEESLSVCPLYHHSILIF